MKKILLASKSPRRRELLAMLDMPFELAKDFSCEEVYPMGIDTKEVPKYLSFLKSEQYPYPLQSDEILLTADTVVIVDNEILGKPVDSDDAVDMLKTLSGRTHSVVTGVTLKTLENTHTFSDISYVTFREMKGEEIRYYVDKYSPLDKAGAYGIQEWIGATAISSINGSYYNIVGLPTEKLYKCLTEMSL